MSNQKICLSFTQGKVMLKQRCPTFFDQIYTLKVANQLRSTRRVMELQSGVKLVAQCVISKYNIFANPTPVVTSQLFLFIESPTPPLLKHTL